MQKVSILLQEIVVASENYYSLLTEQPGFLTYQDFLGQLPDYLRNYFQKKGYEASCKSPVFKRYVLEEKGWSKDQFMRNLLSEKAYQVWRLLDVEANALFYQWLAPAEVETAVY